ncbi:chloride channel protein [Myroides phaeus]|uniref:chloride channel protein n=1 Tax=Myroides phaeus TaxID=702745 RepID=UPI001303390B|nr:chloride channel protein [Myroides phaeus]
MALNDYFKKEALSAKTLLSYFLKWTVISTIAGSLIGSASALFLFLLETVTDLRIDTPILLYFLPLGGLIVGLVYYYWGGDANRGNNLLIDEYHSPTQTMPLKMAPLVLIGTIITHLFGGSAGREGTAVQMGGAIADQFTKYFTISHQDRQTIILIGVSAGFASVFGTPIAGTLFALELMLVGRVKYQSLYPVLIAALTAHFTCLAWGISHTVYLIDSIPNFSLLLLLKLIFAAATFAIAAILFVKTTDLWSALFKKYIAFPPLRPFVGAIIFIALILTIGNNTYLGLGVPTIVASFDVSQEWNVFLLKILFTGLTLGAGFKGGEVTPLFFIGAALGSFLALYLNLPISFLAALGFVSVFSGATKTPWACTFMGIELFGADVAIYIALTCIVAFMLSGKHTIYKSQRFTSAINANNNSK